MQDMSNFEKWFKTVYWNRTGPIAQQTFYRSEGLLARLRKKTVRLSGKELVIPVHKSRHRGAATRDEGAELPDAVAQGVDVFKLQPVYLYAKIKLSGPAIDRSIGSDAAFISTLDFEVRQAVLDARDELNRLAFGSKTGVLATITGGGNSATQPVDSTVYLERGMPCALVNSANGNIITNGVRTIVDIDPVNCTVTFDEAVNTSTLTVYICRPGGTAGNAALAYNNAVGGLADIISASVNWGGVTRSANPWSQATEVDGSAGIDTDLMLRTFNMCAMRGGGKPTVCITSEEQFRALGVALHGPVVWPNYVKKIDFGYDSLAFMGVPIIWDGHCQRDRMYVLDETTLYWGECVGLGWWQKSGQMWRQCGNTDAIEAMLYWRGNLCCTNPRANAIIHSLPLGVPAQ